MAEYVTANAQAARIQIPEFRGLWQHGDGFETDPRYAADCENALTTEGVLRPMAVCKRLPGDVKDPIETLMRLHRRYYTADNEKDVLIAAAGGQLYWRLPTDESWTRIPMPPTSLGEEYQSSRWSWVSYEINPEGSGAPVDVLILSNALDGMLCIRGDDLSVTQVETPKKFGVIARHAERIWGCAIEGEGDMLAYSAPYDPFNWAQNSEIPEDGAGDVLQPSWDGDSFNALTSFGSQLIAFKKRRAWRILGTDPGVYTFKEQFGGGAPFAGTVAVDTARILMLGADGVYAYDGESVAPHQHAFAQAVFERMNPSALDQAAACMHQKTYYCALPLDGSRQNNAVLLYNTEEETWLLREDVRVNSFLSTGDALYFTSAVRPGSLWVWRDDPFRHGCAVSPMRWVSPWQELGAKEKAKSAFTLRFWVDCPSPVTLHVGVETEKRKTLRPVVFPSGETQRRIRFRGRARRFRLVLESRESVRWRILGGVQIDMETETDV